ncbi:DNA-binding protein [Staphylococcus simiae]|uniref:DNA-binding protein n=1 Tax=Staphylococcus simiae TaxID=308354 RepID=UPI001A9707B5|nr:DNA-binding protein [Staphylococcus simiae]MBO1199055.1 DNA-binding protein [Staphylococcus simiae]MBO1201323.1 DNA-binding protein [Staphylococcus simiae]MBO1203433.1 DNA-binding protein [Staphylococcus simiae]MBO1210961.1 DNA-binding protein [Staphylococcus simiae]MBO1229661.1 DNA-binding protein [Staphylococcus simiae]
MTNLPKIGQPASRALQREDITCLEDVTHFSKAYLLSLHGVGPKAIALIEASLRKYNLHFNGVRPTQPISLTIQHTYTHTAKTQKMFDFVVATASLDIDVLRRIVTDHFIWKIPGTIEIHGVQILLQQLSSQPKVTSIDIISILTDGNLGSLQGVQTLENDAQVYFATFFEFDNDSDNANITKATTYEHVTESLAHNSI